MSGAGDIAIGADSSNRIEGNELFTTHEGALSISGDFNHIERNFVGPASQPHYVALRFNAGADNNSYRGNIFRPGSGAASVEDNGTGNLNAGGNICAGTCP